MYCTLYTDMHVYMCAVRYSTAPNVKYSVHCKCAVYCLMKLCIWDFIQLESGNGQEEKSYRCNHVRIQADLPLSCTWNALLHACMLKLNPWAFIDPGGKHGRVQLHFQAVKLVSQSRRLCNRRTEEQLIRSTLWLHNSLVCETCCEVCCVCSFHWTKYST